MKGEVVSIHFVRSDGGPAESAREVEVVTDFGIKDDYRSRKGRGRQLTLVAAETLDHVARTIGHSVPDGASRRQIVVRGLDLNTLIGKRLQIGPVTVSVESDCPPCDRMKETIGPGARAALEGRAGLCCRVVEGGTLHVGDEIMVVDASVGPPR